jgi:hypothetical protein
MTKQDEEEGGSHHPHFGLMHNKRLVKMDLWGNGIGDKGATSLIVGLQKNKTLKTLVLGNNKLEDAKGSFAGALAPHGWKSSLTCLDLQYNSFTGEAIKYLAKSLTDKKSTLKSLDLSRNKLMIGNSDLWSKGHDSHHHAHHHLHRRASHSRREHERLKQVREVCGKNLSDLLSKSHSLTDLNLKANNLRNAETQVLHSDAWHVYVDAWHVGHRHANTRIRTRTCMHAHFHTHSACVECTICSSTLTRCF